MRKLQYLLRLLSFVLLMLLASAGAGITGHFLPTTRERYRDKVITREQVDKKEEENEIESEDSNTN